MISEDLTLNLGPALSEADNFERAFLQTVAQIAAQLAQSINGALAEADAAPVQAAVEGAVAEADKTVTVEPDAAEVVPSIEGAIAEADKTATLEGDAAAIPPAIEEGVEAADRTVVLEGDGADITTAIEEGLEAADTTVTVQAEGAESFQELAAGATEASGGLGNMASKALALKEGTDILSGSVGALSGNVSGIVGKLGPYGAAIAAVGGATTVYVSGAIEAEAVTQRFNRSFGGLAEQVDHIDVGGLNISLSDLAIKLGADDDALRTTASNLAALGQSSGATSQQVAATSEQIIALASYLSATNPTLGSADQIADRLSSTLARGGRATAGLGLALNAADIEARALQMTGKATAEELTIYDKAAAGAALATEQLGDKIGKGVEEGAKTGTIALRSFKTAIGESIEGLGAPLIQPVLSLTRTIGPILGQLATTIGLALQSIVPLFSRAVQIISPFLSVSLGTLNVVLSAIGAAVRVIDALLGPIFDKIAQFAGLISGVVSKVVGWFGNLDAGAASAKGAAQETEHLAESTKAVGPAIDVAGQKVENFAKVDLVELQKKTDETIQKVEEGLPGIASSFDKVVEDSKVSVAELRAALLDQLKTESEFFINLQTIVQKGGHDIAQTIEAMGPERGAALAKAVATSTVPMVAQLEFQANQVKTLEHDFAVQWGSGVSPGFLQGLASVQDQMTTGVIDATKKATSDGKAAAGPGGKEIGAAIGQGMNAGIQSTLADIKATFAQIKTLGANVFQVKSPSRWAIDIGGQIGSGFAIGIERALPQVEAAMASATAPVSAGGSSTITIGPGAVQVMVGSNAQAAEVRPTIDEAFGRLVHELGRR